jgi:hypothetical protein
MPEPIIRQYNKPNAGTIDVAELAQDQITKLTFTQLNGPNAILDMFNTKVNANQEYTIELLKNSISTGRNFFTVGMDPASAGRSAVGPINLKQGQVQYNITQTAGTAVVMSFAVKYNNGF